MSQTYSKPVPQEDVSQFLIVAPSSRLDEITQAKENLVRHLERRFPRYAFDVPPLAPLRDDEEFLIVPIMNYATPDGKVRMCRPIGRWILTEIAEACAEFDPTSAISLDA